MGPARRRHPKLRLRPWRATAAAGCARPRAGWRAPLHGPGAGARPRNLPETLDVDAAEQTPKKKHEDRGRGDLQTPPSFRSFPRGVRWTGPERRPPSGQPLGLVVGLGLGRTKSPANTSALSLKLRLLCPWGTSRYRAPRMRALTLFMWSGAQR